MGVYGIMRVYGTIGVWAMRVHGTTKGKEITHTCLRPHVTAKKLQLNHMLYVLTISHYYTMILKHLRCFHLILDVYHQLVGSWGNAPRVPGS